VTHPTRLYKYRPLNEWTISTIVNSAIYFSTADGFNDPFDCRLRYSYDGTDTEWREALQKLVRRTSPQISHAEAIRIVTEKMNAGLHRDETALDQMWDGIQSQHRPKNGILCLAASPKNILMWSHYADSHKGCCLEFSTATRPFSRALPVKYSPQYPRNRLIDFIGDSPDEVGDKHAELTTYTKSALWKYEAEWRVRSFPQGPGLYKFDKRLLTGIVFGYWMADDHKDMLRRLVSGRNPKVNLFQARPKGRKFEVELLPLT
jgi:hypothetical protein